ncbi:MAG TPA: ubiquinol-cytochrome c reductase iron-sulfur subunit, partial [Stellaceae bacterium]|nr:ubiquinol-cytochrome c reductase iron-sulfur subunit [Stellaceae bacterium]
MSDEAHSFQGTMAASGDHQQSRRDFLVLVAGAVGAVAVVATAYTVIDSLNPAADILAAGGPVDVDLSKVAPGQQVIVQWRGKPIFIIDRTPALLKELQDAKLVERLSDPNSEANQQPPYARNWHRSIDPQYAV